MSTYYYPEDLANIDCINSNCSPIEYSVVSRRLTKISIFLTSSGESLVRNIRLDRLNYMVWI